MSIAEVIGAALLFVLMVIGFLVGAAVVCALVVTFTAPIWFPLHLLWDGLKRKRKLRDDQAAWVALEKRYGIDVDWELANDMQTSLDPFTTGRA